MEPQKNQNDAYAHNPGQVFNAANTPSSQISQTGPAADPFLDDSAMVSDQPNFDNLSRRPKKRNILVTAIALVAGLSILGGGALAYNFLVRLPNTPENVVAKAVANLLTEEADGADYFLSVDTAMMGQGSMLRSLKFDIDMSADFNSEGPAIANRLNVSKLQVGFDELNRRFDVDIPESDLQLELRAIGDKAYARFDGMESMRPAFRSAYTAYAEFFAGAFAGAFAGGYETQKLDASAIETELDTVMAQAAEYEDQWFDFDLSGEEFSIDNGTDPSKLLACLDSSAGGGLLDGLVDRYTDNRFLLILEDYGSKPVQGEDMRNFLINFDSSEFIEFAQNARSDIENDQEVFECIKEQSPEAQRALDDFDAEEMQDSLEDFELEVWIDDNQKLRQVSYSHSDNGVEATVTLGMKFRPSVKIEQPDVSSKFIDLVRGDDAITQEGVLGESTAKPPTLHNIGRNLWRALLN